MRYPTEYNGDGGDFLDNLQKRYYYNVDKVIYKLSSYDDGDTKCVGKWNDLKKDGVIIKLTYKYEGTNNSIKNDPSKNEIKTYLLLDYLIDCGDKWDNGNIKIHNNEHTNTKSLKDKLIDLQKEDIINKLAKGQNIDTIVDAIPSYFKGNNYKIKSGKYKDYRLSIEPSLNLNLFTIDDTETITVNDESLINEMKTKAENECKILANNIMSSVNKTVSNITIEI